MPKSYRVVQVWPGGAVDHGLHTLRGKADVRGYNGRTPPNSGRAGHRGGMTAHSHNRPLALSN
jgi:hypothetical protein